MVIESFSGTVRVPPASVTTSSFGMRREGLAGGCRGGAVRAAALAGRRRCARGPKTSSTTARTALATNRYSTTRKATLTARRKIGGIQRSRRNCNVEFASLTVSPLASRRRRTGWPFTSVPLVDPRSSTMKSSPSRTIRAWLRDTPGSASAMSERSERPGGAAGVRLDPPGDPEAALAEALVGLELDPRRAQHRPVVVARGLHRQRGQLVAEGGLVVGEALAVGRRQLVGVDVGHVDPADPDRAAVLDRSDQALSELDRLDSRLEGPCEQTLHGAFQALFELA